MDFMRSGLFMPLLRSCVLKPAPVRIYPVKLLYNICMRPSEIQEIAETVKASAPCRMLVFGLGNDSSFWNMLNRGGDTLFLEDSAIWRDRITSIDPGLEVCLVKYGTYLGQWRDLLDRPRDLEMDLPSKVTENRWDIILVDAPQGYRAQNPGRMKSIFAASLLRRSDSSVFIHDCNRTVETVYSDSFLGEEFTLVGRLRHYRSNSHIDAGMRNDPFAAPEDGA